uniref:Ankyrin/F-box protein n=1 Tax=Orf virus TaxID=10258 RepID=A0A2S1CI68_ORFV|nr:ankyrin/F-box protein [Orf virus]AXG21575.1 ankyrin/F-box protein [Orf virus]
MLSRESVVAPHADLLFRYLESGQVDLATVRALVATDADVNFRGEYGRTPLHLCVHFARYEQCAAIVRVLLEAGADVNAKDTCGFTPLHAYVQHDCVRPEVVALMLEAGADVVCDDSFVFYDSVLSSFLSSCGSDGTELEVARLLLDAGARVNEGDTYGMTPLHVYAKNQWIREDVLRLLLERGANPNACDCHGVTPLAALLGSGGVSATLVDVMLRAGADARAVDAYGRTTLHHLSRTAKISEGLVRMLTGLGVDPAAVDASGNTMLHYMATYGRCARGVVEFVLECGLDLNLRNNNLQTALHRAAVFSHGACCRLVRMGAELEHVAASGLCAVSEMLRRNNVRATAAVLARRPPTELLVRALLTSERWGHVFQRSEAALLCVQELALRGEGARLLAERALADYATVVRACEQEIASMRAVRCHTDATLLDVLRAADDAKALFVSNAFLERAAEFPIYGTALFGKVCMMRLRVSLAEQIAGLMCPCALPPEIVTSILCFLPYESLLDLRRAMLTRP